MTLSPLKNDKPKVSAKTAALQIISPTNIITGIGVYAITEAFMTLITHGHVHQNDNDINKKKHTLFDMTDIVHYASQIVFSIFSWSVISKFVPHISFSTKKGEKFITLNATDSFHKNNGHFGKILLDGIQDFKRSYRSTLSITAIFTVIQTLTDYTKNRIDSKYGELSITILSFLAKILAVGSIESILNKKPFSPSLFWQSLIETCECCGSPRIACVQIAPVVLDMVKSGILPDAYITQTPSLTNNQVIPQ